MSADEFIPQATFDDKVERHRYKQSWSLMVRGELELGGDTTIAIKEISVAPTTITTVNDAPREMAIIKATVELSATIAFVTGTCCICNRKVDPPDADSLWFILENHDGGRLLFPREAACEEERDRWPVPGWVETEEGLTCPECHKELEEAREQVISRRKSTA